MYFLPKWKKYSQSGEEAYLDHILKNISVNKHLVELGAWDGYHLSNTRYFIEQGYTSTLIDGDNKGNNEVHQSFITRENILETLEALKVPERFDLFCIDLDGNDYYILEEVLKKYKPSVIIAEFNPIFSASESYAITYDPNHTWGNDDYYGFSFKAGRWLAFENGYTCIFQNDSLNMYFVENETLANSLGCDISDISQQISVPEYKVENYHPRSQKTGWVKIEL